MPALILRVLFIGNSLTFANNLPAMVTALGHQQGVTIHCETVAFPDYSLDDHLQRGDAARVIARGGWSFVVLQQGPSALAESRVQLRASARTLDQAVRRAGAKTALYMVWPAAMRPDDFDRVSESYAIAAADVQGLLLPVGEAWRAATRRDPTLALYGSDGFHPTPLGTYLAALVVYHRLSGRSPVGLPSMLRSPTGAFPPVVLTAEQAAALQNAAVAGRNVAPPPGRQPDPVAIANRLHAGARRGRVARIIRPHQP
jgi:hypothetical protein